MIYEEIIKEGDLVFDVGLNIGDKSEIFLKKGCVVVGFEPLFECFQHAKDRLSNYSNFRAENIALDKKEGFEKIFLTSYHTISTMSKEFISEVKKERFKEYDWNGERTITTNTLDNMISKYGKPEYIKIDVEGYEHNVLSGLTSKINLISIEFNPELCSETIKCLDYIDNLNNNNTEFNYVYRFDDNFKFDKWVSKEEISKYLTSVNDFKFEFGDVFCRNK